MVDVNFFHIFERFKIIIEYIKNNSSFIDLVYKCKKIKIFNSFIKEIYYLICYYEEF